MAVTTTTITGTNGVEVEVRQLNLAGSAWGFRMVDPRLVGFTRLEGDITRDRALEIGRQVAETAITRAERAHLAADQWRAAAAV
jgi:hypothetical protein